MISHKISDIATALDAKFFGDGDIVVRRLSEPASARPDGLAIAMNARYSDDLVNSAAQAAIIWEGADWQLFGLDAAIVVQNPRLALATLTCLFLPSEHVVPGIHATVVIAATPTVAENCSIGPFAVIGENVKIGRDARIAAHVTVGDYVTLGDRCRLGAGVRIGKNVSIGDSFHAHPGVVIGADGFSFTTAEKSTAETARETLSDPVVGSHDQDWIKIQSLGGVIIGNDVEVGANSSIDAGTIRPTKIGDGTKIDALVQIGHNVQIGRNCLLCAHVAVGGSALIGNGVVLGGQAGVADNITIGDGVVAGGASKILSNVPAGRAILGYPAVKMDRFVEGYKALHRLPHLLRQLTKDKKPVSKDSGSD
ncbi:MAG: UDP-3-O-(3-hydroxymyristoyl)glucosamine N-acyltransferase [Paracoccaceae bacterium]